MPPDRRVGRPCSRCEIALQSDRRAWRLDETGSALIEAALVFPILFILFFGVSELCEGFIASRRVEAAAFTAADLVARLQTVSSADVIALKSIVDETIKPFPVATVGLVVTSVVADQDNLHCRLERGAWARRECARLRRLRHGTLPARRPDAAQQLGHSRAGHVYIPIDPFDAHRRRRSAAGRSLSTTEVCPADCQE